MLLVLTILSPCMVLSTQGIFYIAPDRTWLEVLTPVWVIFGGGLLALHVDLAAAHLASPDTVLGHPASISMHKRMANWLPFCGVLISALVLARSLDYRAVHLPSGMGMGIPIVICEVLAVINLIMAGSKARKYGRKQPVEQQQQLSPVPLHGNTHATPAGNGALQKTASLGDAGKYQDRFLVLDKNPQKSLATATNSGADNAASASNGSVRGSPDSGHGSVNNVIPTDHTSIDLSVRNSGETDRSDLEDSIIVTDNSTTYTNQSYNQGGHNRPGSNGGVKASEPNSIMSIGSWGELPTLSHSIAEFVGAPRASPLLSSLFKAGMPLTQPYGGGVVLRGNGAKNAATDRINRQSALSITSNDSRFDEATTATTTIPDIAGAVLELQDGEPISTAETSIGGVSLGSGATNTLVIGGLSTVSLPNDIQGIRLSHATVKIGMKVYVESKYADPHAGLYGDTVACDGMLGIVDKCDASETCRCKLADGRTQWIQCKALTGIPADVQAAQLEALSGEHSMSEMLRNLTTQQEAMVVVSPTLERLAMSVIANDQHNAREICSALGPGEIDTLIDGKGLLHAATEHSLLEMVTILLSAGANPNLRDDEQNTPMHWAFIAKERSEDGAAVAAALIDAGANLDAQNQAGLAPLHIAAGKGHLIGTEILIAMQCQVDIPSVAQNETPIFYAMKALSTEIIKLLVEQGACNVNACDGDGDTPLHLSFYIARRVPEFIAVSEYLIQHGANAAAVNQQGIAAVDSCPDEYCERIKELFVAVAVAKLTANPSGRAEFSIGDRVRLRYAAAEPKKGYQGVNPDDLLVVRAIKPDGLVHVSFVDPSMLLQFERGELCPVFDTSGVSITTSSAQASSLNMFDSDRETFWQSDGSRGEHWVLIELPDVVELLAIELLPHRGGVAFIPKKIEVSTGEVTGNMRTEITTQTTTYGWTALVPAVTRDSPDHQGIRTRFVKLMVRTCHEGGINCRIAGLRMLFRRNQQEVFAPNLGSTVPFEPLKWEDISHGEESGKLMKQRYRLGRKIAQGGFGVTYMATDEDCLNEQVVIKFLHRLPGLALFRSEARRLLELDHPQIPKLKAYFELKDAESPDDPTRSKFTLVMEMVHGRNLVELMDDEGPWTDIAVYRMVMSVLSILSHVHRKGVIHRDIKAANVMRRDRDGVFFLVDFGACTYESAERSEKLIGTPGYMAPEAQSGNSCCESDLFGLGALALFMLKGQQPSRLVDKAQPSRPYDYTLKQLRDDDAITDRTLVLLQALLQSSPHQRRECIEALSLDLEHTAL
jgi:ankyrin repeat protein